MRSEADIARDSDLINVRARAVQERGRTILCRRRATWLLKHPASSARILRPHRPRCKCFAICSRRHEEERKFTEHTLRLLKKKRCNFQTKTGLDSCTYPHHAWVKLGASVRLSLCRLEPSSVRSVPFQLIHSGPLKNCLKTRVRKQRNRFRRVHSGPSLEVTATSQHATAATTIRRLLPSSSSYATTSFPSITPTPTTSLSPPAHDAREKLAHTSNHQTLTSNRPPSCRPPSSSYQSVHRPPLPHCPQRLPKSASKI
jgi:hypothetical protein